MKIKATLYTVVALAMLAIAVQTYLIWWAVGQFYALSWQQAFAIYVAKFMWNFDWSIGKPNNG